MSYDNKLHVKFKLMSVSRILTPTELQDLLLTMSLCKVRKDKKGVVMTLEL